jgi:DNA-binding NarL/FixJ family response regulator
VFSLEREEPKDEPDAAPRQTALEIAVFVAIAALLMADVVADSLKTSKLHLGVEIAATAVSLFAAARLWLRFAAARRASVRRMAELRGHLNAAREEAERWRGEAHEALAGLGAAIERQCDRWGLTEAERAVAVLLLKGLSMKEIAEVRGTAERTARQQALAVYRKAGLAGRAELSAFFLEDLLPSRPLPARS